jgi:outer membrane biosynthesis protein TonB
MNVAGMTRGTWRLERADTSRLVWAFAISIALHLLLFGGYYGGKRYHIWDNLRWPAWLEPVKTLLQKAISKTSPPPLVLREREVPLVFVDVSQAQETQEAPKQPKFYSDKSSQAGNPVAEDKSTVANITGVQKDIPQTHDVPRENQYLPLQPSPPKPQHLDVVQKDNQPEEKPKPTETPGDLTMARPDPNPSKADGEAPKERPRTLAAAAAQHPDRLPPGLQMKQEGGVRRVSDVAFDVVGTKFGEYDRALIDAVRQCWYDLLDNQKYAADYSGKVIVHFDLHSDGRISGVHIESNTAGEIPGWLCQTAVDKPSPYAQFPADMRRSVGEIRHIQFTFFYY